MNTVEKPSRERSNEFARAFAAAIAARDVTLESLRSRLAMRGTPVSTATLSSWRSGRRHPEGGASQDAVRNLEELLRVPEGRLTKHLADGRRPHPVGPRTSYDRLFEAAGVDAALATLDLPRAQPFAEVTSHSLVTFAPGWESASYELRKTVRATRDGVTRRAAVLDTIHPDDGPPDVELLAGGTWGRRVKIEGEPLWVFEILLDTELAKGESCLLRALAHYEPLGGALATTVVEGHAGRVREAVLMASFPPEQLPRSVRQIVVGPDGERHEQPVHPNPMGHLSVIRHNFGPGTLRLDWERPR
jgi:hypothetical protein